MNNSSIVDVVIPVYKPGELLSHTLKRLSLQTHPANRIILINTEQKYYDEWSDKPTGEVEVYHITKEEFDHAASRDKGMAMSKADKVLFMTMDAVPKDEHLIENLLKAFEQEGKKGEKTAVAYARQLPRDDCRMSERYTRMYNYPETGRIKTLDDLEELGIKTYFCSDVCAMYDTDIYRRTGGFVDSAIFNEDMLYAAKVIKNGYAVAYCAEAQVVHSHNYTLKEQFSRNFDLGVSQTQHPEVFLEVKSESEGIRMVKKTAGYLFKNGHWYELPYFLLSVAAKYLGYRKGRNYLKLSAKRILKYTMNREYWK